MKHELDDDTYLALPDSTPYTEEQRYGFFIGLADHIKTQYQRDRQPVYPSLGNQLDMLWHELNASGSISTDGTWFNAIKTVKDAHPKTQ
jgi:hypothetical protein